MRELRSGVHAVALVAPLNLASSGPPEAHERTRAVRVQCAQGWVHARFLTGFGVRREDRTLFGGERLGAGLAAAREALGLAAGRARTPGDGWGW